MNEHILDTAPDERHNDSADPWSFPYAKCLSVLSNLETLVEVEAEKYRGDKKWNFITEAIKVILRLALFRNCGYKMLLQGGETPNVEKDSEHTSLQHIIGGFQKLGVRNGPCWLQDDHGQNPWSVEGRALSALRKFGESGLMVSDQSWMQRIKQEHAIMEPRTSVIERPTLSRILSELYLFSGSKLSLVTRSGKSGKEQRFHLSDSENDEVHEYVGVLMSAATARIHAST
ncbi:hypothetical protein F3Y22_tig00001349pilonHSYRG00153 [Hibiscus syriacus]|uniref:Peroxisomal membrane protein PEX16 n=1 Tax=Hibiscus syriacus TaxID=106335 RepID=A0A6A3CVN4_HIBSY|nr:hypothetical protein F3Y22_tig00001349pilonHSYRG00153 [Hibiscus syriacus]